MASQSQRHVTALAARPGRRRRTASRRPSLPGLRMPCGSSAALTAASTPKAGAERLADEPGAVEPDAVVVREVAAVGEHGPLAGVPQGDVRRLDLVGRRRGGEREVEAGAVGVAVREVAAGDAGVRDGEQRRADGVEQLGEPRPRRGDLHRVDDEPLARQRLQRRGVVAVVEPAVDELVAGAGSAAGAARRRRPPSCRRRSPARPRRARAACTAVPSPPWPRADSTAS